MFSGLRAIDISLPLRDGMVRWPGDPPFVREETARLDRGDGVALSVVRMGVHAGSHVDFPAHLLPGGTGADAWPPESFLLPAVVVEHPEGREVPAEALAGLPEAPGEAILFRTGNSVRGLLSGRSPLGEAACLAPAAARACVARRAALRSR